MTENREFRFDGWTLRVRSGELSRGGESQRLPQQPLRVLVELLEQAGEVVTRERLVQVLWPRGVVDFDNSLNAVVRKLRLVLGDDSDQPRYIETLPRIGYRFVAKIEAASAPGAVPLANTSMADSPPAAASVAERARHARRSWVPKALWAAAAAFLVSFAWFLYKPGGPGTPASQSRRDKRPASPRAYELFLDGKFQRSRRDINGTELAVASFEAALKEDPYFVEAWAALAETYTGAGINQHLPLAVAAEKARHAALRAVELDPGTSQGHAALAAIKLHFDNDLAGAELELEHAMRADNQNARMWHTWGLLRGYQGRLDEAFEYIGRAREIEPTAPLYTANYGNLLYQSRRYREAIEHLRPLIASQPRFDQARGILIRALVASGDVKGALEQLPLRFSNEPVVSDDGLVYALLGRRDDARRQVERLERHAKEGFALSYELAILHAALGDFEKACAALSHARDDHSQTQGWMKLDPRMDPLRDMACFAEAEKNLYGPE